MIDQLKKENSGLFTILGYIVKFSDLFRVGLILTNLFLIYRYDIVSKENMVLRSSNAYLQTKNLYNSKAINESLLVWWKKEIFEDGTIIMRDYNNEFYRYILRPLNLGRYFYVNKTDEEVFGTVESMSFYKEDYALYLEFMSQPINPKTGTRDRIIKSYNEEWIDLQGNVNDSGYWRYIREEDGHIYIYGTLKEPKFPIDKRVAHNINKYFIKPKSLGQLY